MGTTAVGRSSKFQRRVRARLRGALRAEPAAAPEMASAAALFAACKSGDAACVRTELSRPGAGALVNAKDVAYVRALCACYGA